MSRPLGVRTTAGGIATAASAAPGAVFCGVLHAFTLGGHQPSQGGGGGARGLRRRRGLAGSPQAFSAFVRLSFRTAGAEVECAPAVARNHQLTLIQEFECNTRTLMLGCVSETRVVPLDSLSKTWTARCWPGQLQSRGSAYLVSASQVALQMGPAPAVHH
jgi:hypothetical protein